MYFGKERPVRKIPEVIWDNSFIREAQILIMLESGKAYKKEEKNSAGNIITNIFDEKGKKIYSVVGKLPL